MFATPFISGPHRRILHFAPQGLFHPFGRAHYRVIRDGVQPRKATIDLVILHKLWTRSQQILHDPMPTALLILYLVANIYFSTR